MLRNQEYEDMKAMLSKVIYLDEAKSLMDIQTDDVFFITLRSHLYKYTHILNLYKHNRVTEQEAFDLFKELFFQIVNYVSMFKNSVNVKGNLEQLHLHALVLKCFTKKTRLRLDIENQYYEYVYSELKENEKIIKNYIA